MDTILGFLGRAAQMLPLKTGHQASVRNGAVGTIARASRLPR